MVCDETELGFTVGPANTVRIWFELLLSSSSQVRITSPRGPTAEIIAGRLFLSHVSPVLVEQSCVSLHMFGPTNDSPGSVPAAMSIVVPNMCNDTHDCS